jgi:hypothetical protein
MVEKLVLYDLITLIKYSIKGREQKANEGVKIIIKYVKTEGSHEGVCSISQFMEKKCYMCRFFASAS